MIKHKAIALMSGGLDSSLAVRLVHDMGIGIIGVHFTGPFCMCNRGSGGCIHFAKKEADTLGIPFSAEPLGEQYLDIVVNPTHGYGSGMNPCLDCRIMMFNRAHEMMKKEGASFILTGEVLGQRPMSQLKHKLAIIERDTGLQGLILRPLSAGNLPITIPEEKGWVDRNKLLSIEGRQRREQMDLAEALKIGDYPCPAGGCLLTDKNFASRLRDHIEHGSLAMKDIALLKVGRHFRLPSGAKFLVGRNEDENKIIEKLAFKGDVSFVPASVMGPNSLLKNANGDSDTIELAANLCSSYCDGDSSVDMISKSEAGEVTYSCARTERSEWTKYKV